MSFLNTFPVRIAIAATAAGVIAYKLVAKIFKAYSSKCVVIDSAEKWHQHEKEILETFKKSKVIGLDCEWVTVEGNRSPISLLQLANDSDFCVLIRLCLIPAWLVPSGLQDLLSDEKILKVGVAIHEDANKLFTDYCLSVNGFIDLRYLATDFNEIEGKSLSLKSLGLELLGISLNKSRFLRCSDWEAPILSPEQIKYAADDAAIAAKIFSFIKMKKSSWQMRNSSNFDEEVEKFVNVPFKQNGHHITSRNDSKKTKGKPVKSRYSKPRQKPMYDNCQLVAPDGELLCSCDKGKAEWYIYKGLGEKISDDPFTVQLNFEPSGRPTLDNVFYTKEKSNQCVVCGKMENFHRKLVVPSEYRKYFPNLMKKNLSHDVLLLCVLCHKKSNILDLQMREKLAIMCDAPLGCKKNIKFKSNPEVARVKSAATALRVSGDKIPEARRKELQKIILNYFDVPEISEDLLENAYNLETNTLNEAFVPHGLKVYQYFCQNGGLIEFEKLWRQHFLDTMKPQFLPSMWSVEHNHKRLAMQVVNHEREVDFDESILGLSDELKKEVVCVKST